MKFCYFDESGMGDEPYFVTVGIIVDAKRMHITKDIWSDFLKQLSDVLGRPIDEFHSREFYRGNGMWRGLDGKIRANIIDAILDWVDSRKHKCVFSGVNKSVYSSIVKQESRLQQLPSMWCVAALHCTLQVQKQHQRESFKKGHSVLIFDREVTQETRFSNLIQNPPDWLDTFYGRKRGQIALNQIVDVPYYADSKHILLAQIADLFAYILRTSAEIQDQLLPEKYKDEGIKMQKWSLRIADIALPRSSRYPAKGRCRAAQLFWDLAPATIRELE